MYLCVVSICLRLYVLVIVSLIFCNVVYQLSQYSCIETLPLIDGSWRTSRGHAVYPYMDNSLCEIFMNELLSVGIRKLRMNNVEIDSITKEENCRICQCYNSIPLGMASISLCSVLSVRLHSGDRIQSFEMDPACPLPEGQPLQQPQVDFGLLDDGLW